MEKVLRELEKSGYQFDNVPRSDGQFLKELMIKTERKNALEIGSANGYSAIWIAQGIKVNNGQLYTIEINPLLAEMCQENILSAGLEKTVKCIKGDAVEVVKELDGNYDFLFFDLGPVDMLLILQIIEGKLTEDVVIALHNLDFRFSYKHLLQYATSKGWIINKYRSEDGNGYGFFVVSKNEIMNL